MPTPVGEEHGTHHACQPTTKACTPRRPMNRSTEELSAYIADLAGSGAALPDGLIQRRLTDWGLYIDRNSLRTDDARPFEYAP